MTALSTNDEAGRLAALNRFEVLDIAPEESFDRITRLAKNVMQMPMVIVNMVDKDRQWFLSSQGATERETARRDSSFCVHAIRQTEPLIVPDTLADARFALNPRVVGEPHVRFYIGVPLRSRDGYNIGTLCCMDTRTRELTQEQVEIMRGFGQLVVNELELRLLANTDNLTGAMSRRSFCSAAKGDLRTSGSAGRYTSVALLDVDHFKAINDTHGHAAGDLVLQRVVSACKSCLRKSDYIGRLGGEEFGVIFPGAAQDTAFQIVDSMRQAVAAMTIGGPKNAISVTISGGVATTVNSTGLETLLAVADDAMYEAKAGGRNRTVALTI